MSTPQANIFLVGLMGSGKTTIGRALAKRLNMRFVDADQEIESRTGASITLIFEIEGEASFRQREADVIRDLTQQQGIVLATGLVVDDAIVMMENIFKRIENGEHPRAAGEKGASEITFAIISTTITLAMVFLPVIFLQGITGRLFREFGLVVASSVLVSALVSLTLTPMMSTAILRHTVQQSWLMRVTEPFFVWLTSAYSRSVENIVRRPLRAALAMLVSVIALFGIGGMLKSELAPLEDRSVMSMNLTAPEGTTYDRMNVIIDSLQQRIQRAVPEKKLLIT
ncbi:MAG: hypothetical protein FGM20_13555, partial [Burkholderiaceae bacterium]|nr:hypothetical protein [Burkholderiaceae bacterium]